MLLHHGAFAASIGCFARLTETDPSSAMGWYGLATALYFGAATTGNRHLLEQAVAIIKTCREIDPNHELAAEFLAVMPSRTPLTAADVDAIPPARGVALPHDLACGTTTFAEALRVIPDGDDRMQLVMSVGPIGGAAATELLLAALSDSDDGVVRAALKRLTADRVDSRIMRELERMHDNGVADRYEPYFSMAARRLALPFAKPGPWDGGSP